MLAKALPLAAIVLAAPLCGGEDRVAALERQKQELLATTVEKKDFWAQVERKGAGAKELRAVQDRLATRRGDLEVLAARVEAAAVPMAEALAVNARAEEVLAEIERREAALDEGIRAIDEKLAEWRRASSAEPAE